MQTALTTPCAADSLPSATTLPNSAAATAAPSDPSPALAPPDPNWLQTASPVRVLAVALRTQALRSLAWLTHAGAPWTGSLVSVGLHCALSLTLALWILQALPRNSDPLALLSDQASEESAPEFLALDAEDSSAAQSADAGAVPNETLFKLEDSLHDVDLQLSIVAPPAGESSGAGAGTSGAGAGRALSAADLATQIGPQVNFFGSQAAGRKFVFVLDASGSMNDGARFQRATRELLQTVEQLSDDFEFYVIIFHDRALPMFGQALDKAEMLPATQENKERLSAWIATVQPTGWTDPRDALAVAIRLAPSAIFFLSDGEFKIGPPEKKIGYPTLSAVNRANTSKIPIHTLAFEDPINARVLRGMARASGGTYKYVPPEK